MTRKLLSLCFLLLAGQALASDACEQRIIAEIPDFLQQYPLSLNAAGQVFPVSADNAEVCVALSSLNISPRAFSTARIALVISDGKQHMEHLLFSFSHVEAEEVRVGFPSTVISRLCPIECGYAEYRYLQQHSRVQQIIADYQQQVADLVARDPAAIFDRQQLATLDFSGLRQTSIVTDEFPEPLPTYSNPELPDDYFFMAGSTATFMNPLRNKDEGYQARMSSQRQPFEYLTDANMPGETVLAHWVRYAHQHTLDTDNFFELFSSRFKATHGETIVQNPDLQIAVSYLIQIYPRMSRGNNGWDGLARVQFNYRDQFERNGDQLWLENRLEQIRFVYENGAWRLDHMCQIDRRTFQPCAPVDA